MADPYDFDIADRVEEFVDSLTKAERRHFGAKIEQVLQAPFRPVFRQLVGQRWEGNALRRARVGRNFRLVYYVEARTVYFVLAGQRSRVYRDLRRLTT